MAITKQRAAGFAGAGILAAGLIWFFRSAKKIPARAVARLDIDRYLGTWYEIARYNYRFEKHLSHVTATYSRNADGSIRVDNKGYDYKNGTWEESVGVAKPVDAMRGDGRLKVSFFGPFYAAYNVIAIEDDYSCALVAGKNLDYLWILSRHKTIPDQVRDNYLRLAANIGYDTGKLIWTKQD